MYVGANVKKKVWNLKLLFDISPFGLCVCVCLQFLILKKRVQAANLKLVQSQNKENVLCFIVVVVVFGGLIEMVGEAILLYKICTRVTLF